MDLDFNIKLISSPEKKEFVFDGDNKEAIDQYLQAFDKVQLAASSSSSSSSDEQSKAKAAIQVAMPLLANEFRHLLELAVIATESTGKLTEGQSSTTYSTTMSDSSSMNYEIHEDDYARCRSAIMIREDVVQLLRLISVRMSSAGYLSDCVQVYVSERSTMIGASFRTLRVSGITAKNLNWGELESMIIDWIKAAKICFYFLFPGERCLFERIFHDLVNSTVMESCFDDTVRDSAIQLFDNIDYLLSTIRPSPERTFRILDLYETLSDLLPKLSGLLGSDSSELLRTKVADRILPKLADLVSKSLSNFEQALLTDKTPASTSPARIHRLTKYVMEYVMQLCEREKTLMALPPSKPLETVESEGTSLLSLHVVLILTSLVSNLEGKAKAGISGSLFFIMNNFYYIVLKINEHPKLKGLVGDNYFNKLSRKCRGTKDEYVEITLKNVLGCLKDDGQNGMGFFPRRTARFKYKLKAFNAEFGKVDTDLANLVVPDFKLLLCLRKSIVKKLVPSYASFLGQCERVSDKKYIKYSAESLETEILKFFIGNHKFKASKPSRFFWFVLWSRSR